MDKTKLLFALIFVFGVFISSLSQVMLKKSAGKKYESVIREYLNPYVIIAYVIFVVATFMTIISYKVIPLSLGPILESSGYLFVTIWGLVFFKEKLSPKKMIALGIIILGIIIYSL